MQPFSFGDFEDPFLAALKRPSAINALAPQPAAQEEEVAPPPENPSWLDYAVEGPMHGLQWIGETLDKPGRAIRGVLGGKPSELLNLIPFSDTLGITDPEESVSGRQLLENAGLVGKNREGWHWDDPEDMIGDVGGWLTEVVTDPTSYIGGFGVLTKEGQEALKATGRSGSFATKLAKRFKEAGKPLADDAAEAAAKLAPEATEAAAKAADDVAEAAAKAPEPPRLADSWADQIRQGQTGLFTVKANPLNFFDDGTKQIGTGEAAAKIAEYLYDKPVDALLSSGLSPVPALRSLYDYSVKGVSNPTLQKWLSSLTKAEPAAQAAITDNSLQRAKEFAGIEDAVSARDASQAADTAIDSATIAPDVSPMPAYQKRIPKNKAGFSDVFGEGGLESLLASPDNPFSSGYDVAPKDVSSWLAAAGATPEVLAGSATEKLLKGKRPVSYDALTDAIGGDLVAATKKRARASDVLTPEESKLKQLAEQHTSAVNKKRNSIGEIIGRGEGDGVSESVRASAKKARGKLREQIAVELNVTPADADSMLATHTAAMRQTKSLLASAPEEVRDLLRKHANDGMRKSSAYLKKQISHLTGGAIRGADADALIGDLRRAVEAEMDLPKALAAAGMKKASKKASAVLDVIEKGVANVSDEARIVSNNLLPEESELLSGLAKSGDQAAFDSALSGIISSRPTEFAIPEFRTAGRDAGLAEKAMLPIDAEDVSAELMQSMSRPAAMAPKADSPSARIAPVEVSKATGKPIHSVPENVRAAVMEAAGIAKGLMDRGGSAPRVETIDKILSIWDTIAESGVRLGRLKSKDEFWNRIAISGEKLADQSDKLKTAAQKVGGKVNGVTLLEDGEAIVKLFESANASTLTHELAHAGYRLGIFDAGDLKTLSNWMSDGGKLVDAKYLEASFDGTLADLLKGKPQAEVDAIRASLLQAEERFAMGHEEYLRTGKAPTPEIKGVFDRVKRIMQDIYRGIVGKGSSIIDMPPEARAFWDRYLGLQDDVAQAAPTSAAKVADSATIAPSRLAAGDEILSKASGMDGADRTLLSSAELRDLTGLPKSEFDREMFRLQDDGKIFLHRHDKPADLTSDQLDKLITDGSGNYYTGISLREPGLSEGRAIASRPGSAKVVDSVPADASLRAVKSSPQEVQAFVEQNPGSQLAKAYESSKAMTPEEMFLVESAARRGDEQALAAIESVGAVPGQPLTDAQRVLASHFYRDAIQLPEEASLGKAAGEVLPMRRDPEGAWSLDNPAPELAGKSRLLLPEEVQVASRQNAPFTSRDEILRYLDNPNLSYEQKNFAQDQLRNFPEADLPPPKKAGKPAFEGEIPTFATRKELDDWTRKMLRKNSLTDAQRDILAEQSRRLQNAEIQAANAAMDAERGVDNAVDEADLPAIQAAEQVDETAQQLRPAEAVQDIAEPVATEAAGAAGEPPDLPPPGSGGQPPNPPTPEAIEAAALPPERPNSVRRLLRKYVEGVPWSDDEIAWIGDQSKPLKELGDRIIRDVELSWNDAKELGMASSKGELVDVIAHFARYNPYATTAFKEAAKKKGGKVTLKTILVDKLAKVRDAITKPSKGMALQRSSPNDLARLEVLKGWVGGTEAINDTVARWAGNADKPQQMLDEIAMSLSRKAFDGTPEQVEKAFNRKVKEVADYISSLPKRLTEPDADPFFPRNAVDDLHTYIQYSERRNRTGLAIHRMLANGIGEGDVPLKNAFKDILDGGNTKNFSDNEAAVLKRFFDDNQDVLKAKGINSVADLDDAKVDANIIKAAKTYIDYDAKPLAEWVPFMKRIDEATDLWKKSATVVWPGFQTRNLASGQFQNAVAGAWSADGLKTAMRMWTGKGLSKADEKLLEELKVYKIADPSHGYRGFGDSTMDQAYELSSLNERPQGWRKAFENQRAGIELSENRMLKPLPDFAKNWLAGGQTAAEYVEFLNRASAFVTLRNKGVTPEQAMEIVNGIHHSYGNLSRFERAVMKRLAPFYSFSRFNLPWHLEQLLKKPGGPLGQSIRLANQPEGYTPEWLGGGVNVPIGEGEDGKTMRYLSGLGLPFEEAFDKYEFGPGGAQRTMENFASQLTPLLKVPIEAIAGKQLFSGRDLKDLYPFPTGNTTVDQLLYNSPAGRAITTARTLMDERKGPLTKAANLLTGLRFTDVDTEQARKQGARQAIYDLLSQSPNINDFDIFSPKKGAVLTPEEEQLIAAYKAMRK